LETRVTAIAGVIFDDAGEALPADAIYLARRLGQVAGDVDVIAYAVQTLGFVHVAPIQDALLIRFEPSTVCHLAAFAAFYEVAGHRPKRLILGSPGKAGTPDRYEIINNVMEGLKRVEAALHRCQGSIGLMERRSSGSPVDGRLCYPPRERFLQRDSVASSSGPRGPAINAQADDYSKRLSRPLDSISLEDEWLGQLLRYWRSARSAWRLPSSESLDPLKVLNIARGRAHIVDTSDSDPEGYRFRIWGTVNSYGGGHDNKTLGDMPAGSMRDDAIEDYWEVVTTGLPTYQLNYHVEKNLPYSYARLLLPLAADGRRVERLVVLINERHLPEVETL
jgi:hypothetical protein